MDTQSIQVRSYEATNLSGNEGAPKTITLPAEDWLPPEKKTTLAERKRKKNSRPRRTVNRAERLRDVEALYNQGKTADQICEDLGMPSSTLENDLRTLGLFLSGRARRDYRDDPELVRIAALMDSGMKIKDIATTMRFTKSKTSDRVSIIRAQRARQGTGRNNGSIAPEIYRNSTQNNKLEKPRQSETAPTRRDEGAAK